ARQRCARMIGCTHARRQLPIAGGNDPSPWLTCSEADARARLSGSAPDPRARRTDPQKAGDRLERCSDALATFARVGASSHVTLLDGREIGAVIRRDELTSASRSVTSA